MGNTMPAMAIDIERRRSQLSAGAGGLSGPALRPITLRWTYLLARGLDIPVIGCGGVAEAKDALEYLIAGAAAVQVGTANLCQSQRGRGNSQWPASVSSEAGWGNLGKYHRHARLMGIELPGFGQTKP